MVKILQGTAMGLNCFTLVFEMSPWLKGTIALLRIETCDNGAFCGI